jgi:hypothetical protein
MITTFSVLSLSAAVDSQTGSMSIFDQIDEIYAKSYPAKLQSLVISFGLTSQKEEEKSGKIMIHAVTPDGQAAKIGDGPYNFSKNKETFKGCIRVNDILFEKEGKYRFVVSVLNTKNEKVGEVVLDLNCKKAE